MSKNKKKLELTWNRKSEHSQDGGEAQLSDVIIQLEVQFQQHMAEHTLFTIKWDFV